MGKKIKIKSDPELAKPHKQGTVFELVQPAVNELGLVYIKHPIYWTFHAHFANLAYSRIKKYEDQILSQKLDKQNVRGIYDKTFIRKLYRSSTELILHTYLLFEYFSLFVLTTVYLYPGAGKNEKNKFEKLDKLELKDKLKHILKQILNKPELVNSKGYSMLFQEWEQIRHNINHPKNENVYNCGKNTWDKVPMAWVGSGKYKKFYEEIVKLFNSTYENWQSVEQNYAKPATLTGVKRGVKSLHTTFVKKSVK